MDTKLKQNLGTAALCAARAYTRYFPAAAGKRWVWDKVIDPRLSWRRYQGVVAAKDGSRFEVDLPDLIQSRIFYFGEWEPYITRFIRDRLQPGDVFVDVGANVGYYTLLAAKIVGPSGHVHAVEASPSIFERLRRNVLINGLKNVTLHHCAASDKRQKLSLYRAPRENIGATTTIPREGFAFDSKVPADTLPSIIGSELDKAALVKIDVEGAEASVIRGLLRLLPGMAADWIVEVKPDESDAEFIVGAFANAGYNAYLIDNDYTVAPYICPKVGRQVERLGGKLMMMKDIVFSKERLL